MCTITKHKCGGGDYHVRPIYYFLVIYVHAGRWQVYLSSVRTRIQKLSNLTLTLTQKHWHFKIVQPQPNIHISRSSAAMAPKHTECHLIKAINKEVCTLFQHIYRYKVQITHQLSGVHLQGCKSKKKKKNNRLRCIWCQIEKKEYQQN